MTSILEQIELVGVGERHLNQNIKISAVDVFRDKQVENVMSCTDNYINVFVNTNPYHLVTWGPFLQYFVLQNENICCYCEPSDIVLSSAKQLSVVPHHLDAQCMHKQRHNKTRTCFRFGKNNPRGF